MYAAFAVRWGIIRIRAEVSGGMIMHIQLFGIRILKKPLSGIMEKKPSEREEKKGEKEAELSLDILFSVKDDIIRLFKAFSFGYFHLNLRFGLYDSAETGTLYGFLMALKGAVFAERRLVFNAYPVFDREIFEPDCSFEIVIRRVFRIFLPLIRIYRNVSGKKTLKNSVAAV